MVRSERLGAPRQAISVPRGTPLAVVYTDIGDSTGASESLGERKAHRQLQRHNRIVRSACAAFRGYEIKLLGDGFQLAFDDVRSALMFAARAQRELTHQMHRGNEIAIRIGAHFGTPIREGKELMGRVAILAQRVMSAARPGEILVTAEATDGIGAIPGARIVERGLYRLKGIRESVALCEVLWRADDIEPAQRRTGVAQTAFETPFVGRATAIGHLEDALTRASGARSAIVVLEADAGMGKTRLVHEFVNRVRRRRVVVAEGRAYTNDSRPFGLLLDALHSLFDGEKSWNTVLPDSLRSLLGERRRDRTRGRGARGPAPDPAVERLRVLEAIVEVVLAPKNGRTTLLFLDDAHDADEDTLEFVRVLGRRLARPGVETRTLVILALQGTELRRGRTFRDLLRELERNGVLSRVLLSGLDENESRMLLKALPGGTDRNPSFRPLFERSGGNPLFLRELARDLSERAESTSDRVSAQSGDLDPPIRLQEVIQHRLARLDAPSLEVLRCCALLSASFSLDVLRFALGRDEESVLRGLEAGLESGLLREAMIDGDVSYTFEHRLIAESLAAQLSLARRSRLHLSLGLALERLHGVTTPEAVSEVAHHLIRAGGQAPAHAVLLHAEAAGDAARSLSALERAAEFYGAARLALERLDEARSLHRAELHVKLSECLGHLGRVDEARTWADRAIGDFDQHGAVERGIRARLSIAGILASHADYANALGYLENSVELSSDRGAILHGTALARLCVALDQTGRPHDMKRIGRRLRALAHRSREPELRERALNVERNWIQNYTTRFRVLPKLTRQLERSATARRDTWFSLVYENEVSFFHFLLGEIPQAERIATRALAKAEKRGRAAEMLNARAIRAICFCFRGAWDTLDEEWSAAAPLLAQVRGALRVGLLLWARRRADLWLGRAFPRAPSPVRIYAGMPSAALAVEASGCLIASEQDVARARARFESLAAATPRDGVGLNWFITAQALCAGFTNLGAAREAAEWSVVLQPFRDCVYLGSTALELGRAASLNGSWNRAASHLDRAVHACRANQLHPLLGLALLERGEVYNHCGRRGDSVRARRCFDEGRALLDRLGMSATRRAPIGDVNHNTGPRAPHEEE